MGEAMKCCLDSHLEASLEGRDQVFVVKFDDREVQLLHQVRLLDHVVPLDDTVEGDQHDQISVKDKGTELAHEVSHREGALSTGQDPALHLGCHAQDVTLTHNFLLFYKHLHAMVDSLWEATWVPQEVLVAAKHGNFLSLFDQ